MKTQFVSLIAGAVLGIAGAAAGAAQIEILSPLPQQVVHDNSGTVVVDVKVDPPPDAARGQAVRILLDGKPASPDTAGSNFTVLGVERGQHWVQALLVDGQGRTLSVSDTVYFTMWQASVNAPPRKKAQ